MAMVFWGMAACAGLFALAMIFAEFVRVRELLERVDRRMVARLELEQALAGKERTRGGAALRGIGEVDQERDTERLAPVTVDEKLVTGR